MTEETKPPTITAADIGRVRSAENFGALSVHGYNDESVARIALSQAAFTVAAVVCENEGEARANVRSTFNQVLDMAIAKLDEENTQDDDTTSEAAGA